MQNQDFQFRLSLVVRLCISFFLLHSIVNITNFRIFNSPISFTCYHLHNTGATEIDWALAIKRWSWGMTRNDDRENEHEIERLLSVFYSRTWSSRLSWRHSRRNERIWSSECRTREEISSFSYSHKGIKSRIHLATHSRYKTTFQLFNYKKHDRNVDRHLNETWIFIFTFAMCQPLVCWGSRVCAVNGNNRPMLIWYLFMFTVPWKTIFLHLDTKARKFISTNAKCVTHVQRIGRVHAMCVWGDDLNGLKFIARWAGMKWVIFNYHFREQMR